LGDGLGGFEETTGWKRRFEFHVGLGMGSSNLKTSAQSSFAPYGPPWPPQHAAREKAGCTQIAPGCHPDATPRRCHPAFSQPATGGLICAQVASGCALCLDWHSRELQNPNLLHPTPSLRNIPGHSPHVDRKLAQLRPDCSWQGPLHATGREVDHPQLMHGRPLSWEGAGHAGFDEIDCFDVWPGTCKDCRQGACAFGFEMGRSAVQQWFLWSNRARISPEAHIRRVEFILSRTVPPLCLP